MIGTNPCFERILLVMTIHPLTLEDLALKLTELRDALNMGKDSL